MNAHVENDSDEYPLETLLAHWLDHVMGEHDTNQLLGKKKTGIYHA